MATPKPVLGKGLSALLPQAGAALPDDDGTDAAAGATRTRLYNFEERRRLAGRVAELDVDTVRPNPYQPRKDFDETALDELAASVTQLGIIQPITVRALGDGMYELISGERRLRASRRAGLKRIPAYVREADTEAMLEMAIVENVQREDLNPVEVALGYQRLMEEVGLTQEQVADKVGKNRSTVANVLRLLRLPPRVQASLREGTLSAGHARSLVSVDDEAALLDLHRAILDEGLSVREVERRTRRLREAPTPAERPSRPAAPELSTRDRLQVEAMEERVRSAVASQVSIRSRADGSGTVEIAYYSADDLARIVDVLTGR